MGRSERREEQMQRCAGACCTSESNLIETPEEIERENEKSQS